jgi:acetolactate synthase-1/2/3 large subunit
MGLGGFPASNPLFLGMLGMHGTYPANMAVSDSDLIIAVGARFDDRVTGKIEAFAPEAKIIHIDIDPSAISKNIKVDIPIVGDARNILKKLIVELKKRTDADSKDILKDWLKKVKSWVKEYPLEYTDSNEVIKPQRVVREIHRLTKGEAIVTTDVGQNQMWAAQYYKFEKPRRFLTSGGLGTMGYGLPAAIGAQVGNPESLVFVIAGDGSFQMNSQELITAVQYELPIKVAILNNGFLGMVRQWQELFFNRRYSATDLEVSPDFVELARAYGAVGMKVEMPSQVAAVIKEALNTPGPVVMDFRVDREENVFPMVPAGAAIRDMLLGPPEEKKQK